ncbi:MAG TPA: S41 family peptidase [Bauldia sp.]|nr:S41 family peptidase [Bauldia sp.]
MTLRHAARGAALLLLLPLSLTPAFADVPKSGNAVFDAAVGLIEKNFYSPAALPAFDAAATAVVNDATGKPLVTGPAIDKLIAALGVSHTGRYTPDQVDYYELSNVFRFPLRDLVRRQYPRGEVVYEGIGIASKVIDGRRFVTDVYDGAPAALAGVKAGDEILSVDGKPFSEVGSFGGKSGGAVALEVRHTADAAPMTLKVGVEKLDPMQTYMDAIRDSVRIIDRDGRKIGYVHIWVYTSDEVTAILNQELATKLKDVDGMIVDMRSRWGGGPADAAETFVGGSADMQVVANDGKPEYINTRFHKPVVAIIDEGTRSSMEIMAYGLKKNGIPLVGQPTAGDVLAARAFALPDDSILELAVADVIVDGQRLEANPVTPTVAVPFDVRYANGADPQMDAALAAMGKRLAAGVN